MGKPSAPELRTELITGADALFERRPGDDAFPGDDEATSEDVGVDPFDEKTQGPEVEPDDPLGSFDGLARPVPDPADTTYRMTIEASDAPTPLEQAAVHLDADATRALPDVPVGPPTAPRRGSTRSRVVGEPWGPFRILGRIGEGGMAEVHFAAWCRPDGQEQPCVVKRIRARQARDAELLRMFHEEARVGALLDHPNIVRQLDTGLYDGVPYIALELVDGMSAAHLDLLAAPETIPVAVVLDIGLGVARALAYAQDAPGPGGAPLALVHRDLSPHNVLLSRAGAVKLADFGIARFTGRGMQTQFGLPKGKVPYMAPEQLRLGELDARADLYALGVVLVELLSGEPLNPDGVLFVEDQTDKVTERLAARRVVEPRLVELLVALTAIDRARRPAGPAAVVAALEVLRSARSGEPGLSAYLAASVLSRVPPIHDAGFAALLERIESALEPGAARSAPPLADAAAAMSITAELDAPVVPSDWEDESGEAEAGGAPAVFPTTMGVLLEDLRERQGGRTVLRAPSRTRQAEAEAVVALLAQLGAAGPATAATGGTPSPDPAPLEPAPGSAGSPPARRLEPWIAGLIGLLVAAGIAAAATWLR